MGGGVGLLCPTKPPHHWLERWWSRPSEASQSDTSRSETSQFRESLGPHSFLRSAGQLRKIWQVPWPAVLFLRQRNPSPSFQEASASGDVFFDELGDSFFFLGFVACNDDRVFPWYQGDSGLFRSVRWYLLEMFSQPHEGDADGVGIGPASPIRERRVPAIIRLIEPWAISGGTVDMYSWPDISAK